MSVSSKKSDFAELEQQIWDWLGDLPDPEIPVVSVVDLGMIRGVHIAPDHVEIEVAPTYSGCPATEVIERGIVTCLEGHGLPKVSITRVLSPPWTTDWISDAGRDKLQAYGIAPPERAAGKRGLLDGERSVLCPRCGAAATTLVSEFGSTACKASYRCDDCLEPFEYFKCI